MNDNNIVKEYEINNPLIQRIDSLIDTCIRDCHDKCFHTFDHICEYDLNFTIFRSNETVNFIISDKSTSIFESNKKLTLARQKSFIFIQINKLTTKIYSNLSHINIHYYLKLRIPTMHRHFFIKISHNGDNIQTHCNYRRNPVHFACRQWFLYINPQ